MRISVPCTVRVVPSKPDFFAINQTTGEIYFQKYGLDPGQEIEFNLPQPGPYNLTFNQEVDFIGIYDLKKVPVTFSLPKFDNPEPISGPVTIVIDPELKGTPAQTIPGKKLIKFQPAFKFWPDPIKKFMFFHELGHWHYESCFDADLFAIKNFFEAGYDISQAIYALVDFRNYSDVSAALATQGLKIFNQAAHGNK